MKSIRSVLLGVTFASLMFGSTTIAIAGGTYDGQTPSEEQVCDDAGLQGGAYGLCIAYCEATDCDLRPNRRDCRRIRTNFARRTGSTLLPCDVTAGSGGVQ